MLVSVKYLLCKAMFSLKFIEWVSKQIEIYWSHSIST